MLKATACSSIVRGWRLLGLAQVELLLMDGSGPGLGAACFGCQREAGAKGRAMADSSVDTYYNYDERQWKSRRLGGGPIRRGPVCLTAKPATGAKLKAEPGTARHDQGEAPGRSCPGPRATPRRRAVADRVRTRCPAAISRARGAGRS